MRRSSFFVSVGGLDITSRLSSRVTSITVRDASGETADTATIEVDDTDGIVAMPPIGDPIVIGLGWVVPTVVFEGVVDDVDSSGSRSGGRAISIAAKSVDTVKGRAKQPASRHMDEATLGDVLTKWAAASGVPEVHIHPDLASIARPWWGMTNESLLAWGERTARSLGATFKIMGGRAVMVPRSAGVSAGGRPLIPITAQFGVNLISWNIKPLLGRPQHAKFRARWFDPAKASHEVEAADPGYETEAEAEALARYPEADKDASSQRSKAEAKESDRERGGGSVEIDGEPGAQAEATCIIVGARPGVDGVYRIDSVEHRRTRSGGFTTSLTLKQPTQEGAGGGRSAAPADTRPTSPDTPAPTVRPSAGPSTSSSGGGGVGSA